MRLYHHEHFILYDIHPTALPSFSDDSFLSRVSALLDVYTVLAGGSRVLQKVQQMPWENMSGFDSAIRTTKRMGVVLDVDPRRNTPVSISVKRADMDILWPTLAQRQQLCTKVVSPVCLSERRTTMRSVHS